MVKADFDNKGVHIEFQIPTPDSREPGPGVHRTSLALSWEVFQELRDIILAVDQLLDAKASKGMMVVEY